VASYAHSNGRQFDASLTQIGVDTDTEHEVRERSHAFGSN
jgi:hypothetical protein